MKLFNTIAAAAVAIGASITAASPANASYHHCYRNESGNHICIHSVRKSTNFYRDGMKYVVASVNGGARDGMWVECPTHIQANYKENMYGIACYQFD
ncbi:hypothetical protein KQ296_03835 [Synechococcus sp. CS-197]|nr:hypothetical protein [Synechococcus sp. CS-197]